jgi:hypothetical protein
MPLISFSVDSSDCQATAKAAAAIYAELPPEKREAFEADINMLCAARTAVTVEWQNGTFVAYASSAFLDVLRAYSGNPVI